VDEYLDSGQQVRVPALRTGLREDLYLILGLWDDDGATATFTVFLNPLAGFLWFGGLMLLIGGATAQWPAARPERPPAAMTARRAAGIAVVISLTVCVGVAVWGGGCGVQMPWAARSLVGQPAPDFSIDLLDGSTMTLSDVRGRVVVVNFWATWCPSCVDELPDLQEVWETYQRQDVLLLGIALQDDEVEVQQVASRLGLTYPVGLADEPLATAYGVRAVPETFVLDQRGTVAYRVAGPVSTKELLKELDRLLTMAQTDIEP
jgi:peroxiredoxin